MKNNTILIAICVVVFVGLIFFINHSIMSSVLKEKPFPVNKAVSQAVVVPDTLAGEDGAGGESPEQVSGPKPGQAVERKAQPVQGKPAQRGAAQDLILPM